MSDQTAAPKLVIAAPKVIAPGASPFRHVPQLVLPKAKPPPKHRPTPKGSTCLSWEKKGKEGEEEEEKEEDEDQSWGVSWPGGPKGAPLLPRQPTGPPPKASGHAAQEEVVDEVVVEVADGWAASCPATVGEENRGGEWTDGGERDWSAQEWDAYMEKEEEAWRKERADEDAESDWGDWEQRWLWGEEGGEELEWPKEEGGGPKEEEAAEGWTKEEWAEYEKALAEEERAFLASTEAAPGVPFLVPKAQALQQALQQKKREELQKKSRLARAEAVRKRQIAVAEKKQRELLASLNAESAAPPPCRGLSPRAPRARRRHRSSRAAKASEALGLTPTLQRRTRFRNTRR